jgi:hypothetical protein
MAINGGGPAFPAYTFTSEVSTNDYHGMSLRDYFAAHAQADDRLVKVVRAMDDSALEFFALHPDAEREEHITEVELTCWAALPSEVAKVARRLELEARAIARVRYMQADAMLAEREKAR